MKLLNETLKKITSLDEEAMSITRERIDNLIKPIGSMGKLEDIAVKLSGITGELHPKVDKKAIIVLAGDHGVCEEGIAKSDQIVTAMQTINFTKGLTGVCAVGKLVGADIISVNVGVKHEIDNKDVINKVIRRGTNNIKKGPAMSREEAIRSIEIGIEVAIEQIKKGKNILATGEMGIGNTTPTTAILSAIAGYTPEEITGIGANLPVERLQNKIDVIKTAIKVNKPNPSDAIDVLAKVGGFEIGAMAGVMIAGAAYKVPVVIDGYISTISAILACTLEPKVKEYLLPSHKSHEKGAKYATQYLGLNPMLDMDMRLGEGSGAALAFNIIESATYMNKEMITFAEAGIQP
ncbi:nicotinate-nucleotide--dimethylbenzimidazole phosphoribosyltransferase [Clostridiaceae bacterium M8S5]|nr:nicotinate-nucleotide--dimethylbenzimidazole phosphoribosyltransferase [Clostridiaceae bacterium M8S5]